MNFMVMKVNDNMKYRHEDKYIVDYFQAAILKNKLQAMLNKDINGIQGDGTYLIRSLYFDDYWDCFMAENEDGVNNRLKIRIRTYNNSKEIIKLEHKYKLNGLTKKDSYLIDINKYEEIIEGKVSLNDSNRLLNDLYIKEYTRILKPKIIVEYNRTAFTYYAGNVRITFDSNIKASNKLERFFEENIYAMPILGLNQLIIEVKYDGFLPDGIKEVLDIGSLQKTSYSKYYLSRAMLG